MAIRRTVYICYKTDDGWLHLDVGGHFLVQRWWWQDEVIPCGVHWQTAKSMAYIAHKVSPLQDAINKQTHVRGCVCVCVRACECACAHPSPPKLRADWSCKQHLQSMTRHTAKARGGWLMGFNAGADHCWGLYRAVDSTWTPCCRGRSCAGQ